MSNKYSKISVKQQVINTLRGEPRVIRQEKLCDGLAALVVSWPTCKRLYRFRSAVHDVSIDKEIKEFKSFDEFKEYVRRYFNYAPSR